MSLPKAELGVFGGSGFYSFLDGVTERAVKTPYGDPSDKVAIGEKTLRNRPPQTAQVVSGAADIDCTTSTCSPQSVQAYS